MSTTDESKTIKELCDSAAFVISDAFSIAQQALRNEALTTADFLPESKRKD